MSLKKPQTEVSPAFTTGGSDLWDTNAGDIVLDDFFNDTDPFANTLKLKYWDNTAWVAKPLKRWDGSEWVKVDGYVSKDNQWVTV